MLHQLVTRGYDSQSMARPQTYSPARRFMMQGIMWIILGASVGLAALVSHHRRSAFELKLAPPITYRTVTVQLPKGWKLTKNPDELSSTLITADESADSSDEDEESGGRTIRIVHEPLGTYRTR